MKDDDYSILDDWRSVPGNPNMLVRADGSTKQVNPITYGSHVGAACASRMFSAEEISCMKWLIHRK